MTTTLPAGARVHIMGIGGAGMSAIARVMFDLGYAVSGCDAAESPLMAPLRERGIPIEIGHDAAHLDRFAPSALVISSAVTPDNPEVVEARQRGMPVFKRADIMGALMEGRTGVAIAGTHGKTTTTAMVAFTLSECGLDPSFIVGGTLLDYKTNARAGQGKAFVVEADEYDGMFLGLRPRIAVVTSLEMDHPDQFEGLDALRMQFHRFVDLLPADGLLICAHDDHEARELAAARLERGQPATTYGLTGIEWWLTGWQASNVEPAEDGGMSFTVERLVYTLNEEVVVEQWPAQLKLPGEHNIENALACIAVAAELGVEVGRAVEALKRFSGTGRRFEVKGKVKGVTVVDDYAHHPTAIERTLEAARDRYGDAAIWAVWQPHTYSRTAALRSEFARCFYHADHVIITDVFKSRDTHDHGVSVKDVLDEMDHSDARHIGALDEVISTLAQEIRAGDVVIVMSAGDATRVCDGLLKALGQAPI